LPLASQVNIEVDVLGKYVERSLASVLDRLDVLESKATAATAAAAAPGASKSGGGGSSGGGGDVEHRLGAVEQKVTNRDLILDTVEARLARIEKHLNLQ
jgi:hypothetical protein